MVLVVVVAVVVVVVVVIVVVGAKLENIGLFVMTLFL